MSYLPAVFLSIDYLLMHYQLHHIVSLSKMGKANGRIGCISDKTAAMGMRTFFWCVLAFYVIFETVSMVTFYEGITNKSYHGWQVSASTGIFILFCNLSLTLLYCKLAGLPWISTAHYKSVGRLFVTSVIWSCAMFIKLFINTYNLENNKDATTASIL